MNKILKSAIAVAFGTILAGNSPIQAADAADMPAIMTIKTNIYGYQGPDNNFTIYFGSTEKDCEFYVKGPKTEEYIYVDPYSLGTDSDGSNTAIATAVPLSVTDTDNTVTIYGDASKLDYIDIHGCYIGEVQLSPDLKNLSVIDLSHNELSAIDLSPYTAINSIDLTDNWFTDATKMKIGTNHPDLLLLQVGINDAVDAELDLKNFPALQYFSARNNYGLTSVDPTGCPNLVSLVLEVTNISSIDVSKNKKLDVLNLSNTKITSVDLSNNLNLGEFYLSHVGSYNNGEEYKVSSIDVSKNTKLEYLDLSGNKLTSIDLSNNPNLLLLYLQHNKISEIDLSKNTRLASVNLSNNLFTFATLPLPQAGWDYLYYRSPLECNFKYKVNESIDFSKDVIRAPYKDAVGNTISPATYATPFGVQRAGDVYEIDESLYEYADGVITFKEAIADSVYIEFYCTAFPDWTLRSSNFKVKTAEEYDKPSVAFSFTPAASMAGKNVSFKLGGSPVASNLSLPADIIISTNGSETVLKGAVTQATLPESANISFTLPATVSPVDVLITDGFGASALEMTDVALTAIDLNQAEGLTNLKITGAGLSKVDLKYNRILRSLDLSGNQLTSIDLSGIRGDYQKFELSDINLSNNRISSISIEEPVYIENLDISNNRFSQLDFKYYTGLKNLDISGNQLTGELDLSTCEALTGLNAANNELTAVIPSNGWSKFKTINLAGNYLSFATLPVLTSSSVAYTYAPQRPVRILPAGAAINLSEQNVGAGTSYLWRFADNKTEVSTDLYIIDNGVTRFNESLIGSTLYCEMTNSSFPAFYSYPLATTNITVTSKPTNLVASFTPAESGTAKVSFRYGTAGSNAIYIDRNGDGSQYDEFVNDISNPIINCITEVSAGKTVKVYTYGDPADVTMMFTYDTKLKDLDVTPMAKAEAFDIHNAGLTDGNFKLPKSEALYELVLDGNNFVAEKFEGYPALSNLNLAGNSYTEFDASLYPNVSFMQLSGNRIKKITFGQESSIYQLDLTSNQLDEIDLTGTTISELLLADNNLKTIDLSPIKDRVRALNIAGNYFTFATLPRIDGFPNLSYAFYYANQKPFTVECVDGNVDLSTEASVGDKETTYRWFLGDNQSDVYYDAYYEMFIGEELEGIEVSSDPEYIVNNGVTSFLYTQPRKVICAMTNDAYPNLILYTAPVAIDKASGLENVAVDGENGPVDVYNIFGVRVRSNVQQSEALNGLAPGLYIVGTRKYIVR